ncbi:WYL domain-containing protein [Microbacterium karelineae]|uniref:WYL domain-containing protein n=1 Tax=Microbacterium karelineae TaxID=2654283 RepID=UPI0018D44B21|nr:WYL domain-containing protein [Microbacterium karelineae]
MVTAEEAVALRQAIDRRYVSHEGVSSRRVVQPYSLVPHSDRWYLVAFDTDQQEERTFRVDRVRSARSLRETFTPPHRPDAQGHLLDLFARAQRRWHFVLRIRTTEDRIRLHLPRSVSLLGRLDSGEAGTGERGLPWYRAEIHAESLDWLPSVIEALDCEVAIDGPDELRDRVRAAAARMLRATRSGSVAGRFPNESRAAAAPVAS